METTLTKEASSFAIEDWVPEAESPGEKESCLCSALSPDINEHGQLMCAWYTAMNSASGITHLPPPWAQVPQEDGRTPSHTNGAELPPLSPIHSFTFDEISPSAPPSTSAQQAPSPIQTDPEKIPAARTEATRQKSIARKAKLRHAHLDSLHLHQTLPQDDITNMPINNSTPASSPRSTPAPSSHSTPTNEKPPYTYPQLARLALLSQPNAPMTTVEIRTWIAENFAYYRCTEAPWRCGVSACLRKGEGFVGVEGGRWRLRAVGEGV